MSKKVATTMLCLVLTGSSINCASSAQVSRQPISSSSQGADSKSPPTDSVKEFWARARSGSEYNDFVAEVPSDFFDTRTRCSSKATPDQSDEPEPNMSEPDGFREALQRSATRIREKQFDLDVALVYREWKNEAIVEVRYASEPNVISRRFFFLTKKEDRWKIFFDSDTADLLNKEFARFDCS